MKVKILSLLMVLALSVTFFAGCNSSQNADNSNSATNTDETIPSSELGKTKFVVGFDADFPPYGYKDESGNYVGFDLDLAAEVATRNDWDVVFQPISWDAKDSELSSGTIDCIWNGFTMNGREDKYTWSDPYVDNSQVVVVKKDSGITKLSDLKDKNVCVQADSSAQSALTNKDNKDLLALAATFKNMDVVQEYNTAFMNLESGADDAIAIDIGVAQYQVKSRGEDKFVILDEKLTSENYGVGFALGNTELRDKVQTALDAMMKDGTFKKIADKWELTDSVIIKK